MLPDCLECLNLISKSQKHKVLNKNIYADNIKLQNFTLLGKTFSEHSKIYLKFCKVNFILTGDEKYIINKYSANTLIIKEQISIEDHFDIDKIFILSKKVSSILPSFKFILAEPIQLYQVKNGAEKQSLLNIFRTKNVIIEVEKQYNYNIFHQLNELKFYQITKSAQLTIGLQKLKISFISEQDLDFRYYKDLEYVKFDACQINKFITKKHTSLKRSTVNYNYAITQNNFYTHMKKAYNQQINLLKLDHIQIKTLQLDCIVNLHEIYLYGINTIITHNDSHDQGKLDFSIFPQLLVIYLKNITCDTIKFGSIHKKKSLQKAQKVSELM